MNYSVDVLITHSCISRLLSVSFVVLIESVIVLNLLKTCGVKEVLLAGFDGFMVNINENYSDPNLRRPVSVEQVERRNAYYKRFIGEIAASGVLVTFVTPSKYQ